MAARALGVDVGTVRVGVAMSDPMGMFASPLEVIERRRTDPFVRLAALVAEHAVGCVVVGQPLRLCGEVGPAAQAAEAFRAELQTHVDVPVLAWDERLSTAEAQRSMVSQGARREKRRATIDKVAAAIVLQAYLDAQSHAQSSPWPA